MDGLFELENNEEIWQYMSFDFEVDRSLWSRMGGGEEGAKVCVWTEDCFQFRGGSDASIRVYVMRVLRLTRGDEEDSGEAERALVIRASVSLV